MSDVTTVRNLTDIYNKAADIMERQGHTKYRYQSGGDNGPVCLFGALNMAFSGNAYESGNGKLGQTATNFVAQEHFNLRGVGVGVVDWNDADSRTKEEVVAFLRHCAQAWTDHGADFDGSKCVECGQVH